MIVLGIVSFVLLLLITLQEPKEEGLGAIGGSASMFHGASPRSKLFDKCAASWRSINKKEVNSTLV